MKTGLVLYINNDLCELYVVEDNRRSFAFIPDDLRSKIDLGDRYVVYPHHQMMQFSRKEVNLC